MNKYQPIVFGRKFENPFGLAAGLVKSLSCHYDSSLIPFGFIEIGTYTRKKELGNPNGCWKEYDEFNNSTINNIGFKNPSIYSLYNEPSRFTNIINKIPVGISISSKENNFSRFAHDIQVILNLINYYNHIIPRLSYVTINLSSPNTYNLCSFLNPKIFRDFIKLITDPKYSYPVPIVVKISPNISSFLLESVINICLEYKIAGLIVSNTLYTSEGGIGGSYIFNLSNHVLKEAYKLSEGKLLLIGCGGVMNGHDVFTKIAVGATLVQGLSCYLLNRNCIPTIITNANKELSKFKNPVGIWV